MGLMINKEQLRDYFSGHATILQKQMIEEWIKDPNNEEFFYQCLHEWETDKPALQANLDSRLEKFKKVINGEVIPKTQIFEIQTPLRRRKGSYHYLLVACILLTIISGTFFLKDFFLYKIYETSYGETRTLLLSDGSTVSLNANSKLSVPRWGFFGETRKVSLKGEANFSIAHTPDHKRFLVVTDSALKIEVLGTEFNVFARRNLYKVALIKGKVRLSYTNPKHENQNLFMSPGDVVTFNDKGKIDSKKVSHPEKYIEWKNQKMLFDTTPMSEVVTLLEDNYGLKVEVEDARILEKTVTGSFRAKDADDFLLALSEILEIKVTRKENNVILRVN
jgi:transmembrane sensor